MDKYYYFVAQLPFLQFAKPTYIKRDIFLEEAEKWLMRKEFCLLKQVEIDNFEEKSELEVFRKYQQFERSLRYDLAYIRGAIKNKKEYKIPSYLNEIFTTDNPWEIEKRLLYLRWQYIEEEEFPHNFNFAAIVLYYLKLQILEKFFTFDSERGMKRFDEFTQGVNINW